MLNILSFTPSITEFIQGSSDFFPTFIEINKNFLGRAINILNFVRSSKFYRRHSALLEKYSVSLKTLLQQGISKPEFYDDLVYEFRKK